MRITSPEELLQTGQVIPIRQLITLAEKWGFQVRSAEGSHYVYRHRTHPSVSGTLNESTHKVTSQRLLAKAFERATALEQEKEKQIQFAIMDSSADRLHSIRAQLPLHITADATLNGHIILRDKQVPQIGITLYSSEEDRLIENKIHNIMEPMKRSFYIELSKLRHKYDAQAHFDDDGTFTGHISHIVYSDDISANIPIYQEDADPAQAFPFIHDLMEQIEEKDLDQAIRKEELLARPFLGRPLITHADQRGERHVHVPVMDPAARGLTLTFTTFSHQRVAGDGSRGRISDKELGAIAWKIGMIEKRMDAAARKHQPAAQAA